MPTADDGNVYELTQEVYEPNQDTCWLINYYWPANLDKTRLRSAGCGGGERGGAQVVDRSRVLKLAFTNS